MTNTQTTTESNVLSVRPLGMPWPTPDPFLFCVHHLDHYPQGNEGMGPEGSLAGRDLGMDFSGQDGWSMYHGREVPGFPRHPHRGFETVTIARRGRIDHSDSLGATARFGDGDVQWMTAGRGIVHAEMFPCLHREEPNPTELFQIWLNLPAADKMVEPHFKMLWSHTIPTVTLRDDEGRETEVTLHAGELEGKRPPGPPPHSWAARPEADVAIWTLRMAPGAVWRMPATGPGVNRMLYPFDGQSLRIDGAEVPMPCALELRQESAPELRNGDAPCELLLLQGRAIGEPVAHHGPFVMNTREELVQAVHDYQRTEFGGWPWPSDGPVHPREQERHAKHPDGRLDRPMDAEAPLPTPG